LVIDVLRIDGLWTADSVLGAIGLASPELGSACRDGLTALERNEGWLAAHALVPQLERAVRQLAAEAKAPVSRRATRGGIRWASLEELLDESAVSDALDEGLADGIRRLFVDPFGFNYRNDVAHGAAAVDADHLGTAWMALMAILTVARRALKMRATSV
jgi:hypothetical protein